MFIILNENSTTSIDRKVANVFGQCLSKERMLYCLDCTNTLATFGDEGGTGKKGLLFASATLQSVIAVWQILTTSIYRNVANTFVQSRQYFAQKKDSGVETTQTH